MKRTTLILLCLVLPLYVINAWAQSKDKKPAPKPKPIPVYLGYSTLNDGNVRERLFDSLVLQGLTSKDSIGNPFRVDGFLLTYGERNLYEDSVGRLMMLTDFLSEYCYGDTLSPFLKNNITDRSKAGDTVYFDQITVTSPEGKTMLGKSMRFVLTK